MLDPFIVVAAVSAIPPTVAAVAGLVMGVLNRNKLHVLHLQLNSRLDELLVQRAQTSHAEGMAQGIEEERSRPRKNSE